MGKLRNSTLIFIVLLILLTACDPIQKKVGQSCKLSNECENYKCINGFCAPSELNEYCKDTSFCKNNLICKESKCQNPPALCAFKDYSSISKTIGVIMLALLILGSIFPLPTAAFGASITHGGTRVVGYILIMAIFLTIGFYLMNNCF